MTERSVLEFAALAVAGLLAGTANAIVGSGSLLTFPTLLALGYSPVVANVSNTVGLVFGSVSGVVGYRRELSNQQRRAASLSVFSVVGAVLGAALLLVLPQSVFRAIVPILIVFALVLVILQPRLRTVIASLQKHPAAIWGVRASVFGVAIYGGYFGAAQSVILVSLLGVFIDDSLQRLNALKNVLSAVVNASAAVVFVFFAHVAWFPAAVIAGSSIVGGQLGAFLARRLSPNVLRVVIVVAGIAALVKLLA